MRDGEAGGIHGAAGGFSNFAQDREIVGRDGEDQGMSQAEFDRLHLNFVEAIFDSDMWLVQYDNTDSHYELIRPIATGPRGEHMPGILKHPRVIRVVKAGEKVTIALAQ